MSRSTARELQFFVCFWYFFVPLRKRQEYGKANLETGHVNISFARHHGQLRRHQR